MSAFFKRKKAIVTTLLGSKRADQALFSIHNKRLTSEFVLFVLTLHFGEAPLKVLPPAGGEEAS